MPWPFRRKRIVKPFSTLLDIKALYEQYTGDAIPGSSHPSVLAQKLREAFPEVEGWGTMPAADVYPTLVWCIEKREATNGQ